MARAAEKAQNLLNKWVSMKQDLQSGRGGDRKRPFIASSVDDLGEAERWRRDLLREIAENVGRIQNANLGPHVIRDLNDKINKLLREKHHWNRRIKELGGPDYNRLEPQAHAGEGIAPPGAARSKGPTYLYFGAARELPGVRELFEAPERQQPKRKRADLYRLITPDYYGYRDEEDDTILALEAKAEREAVDEAMAAYEASRAERRRLAAERGEGAEESEESESEGEDVAAGLEGGGKGPAEASGAGAASLAADVAVPTVAEFRSAVLGVKKASLLSSLGL